MSVVGIDFGNESCYVAVARGGGIETIANDYSLRATPSCVAFQERSRIAGVAAANARVTNMKNTIVGFKRLLGRKFNDPYVQHEIQYAPYQIVSQPDGSIGIKVRYMDEEEIFSPEQLTAMLLTHLKTQAEAALGMKVHDCVISVPWYFTHAERTALMDAAHIAGLNVLRLFNETSSAALAYGIYKKDLPTVEEKPRNVVFVDCGHSALQVSVAAFNQDKLKMLATAADANLGGRDFDRILTNKIAHEFLAKYKVDALKNPRAYLRLSTEVEKLKKQMSANSTKLPLNIECFMDDKDVSSSMQRQDMEDLCQDLFKRVEHTLLKCLHDSRLSLDEIYAVEIIGGSSRIPAIKRLIEEVFKKPASTTLNQDEAVARGCALECATISPGIRVRKFETVDVQNYPFGLKWVDMSNKPCELEMFPPLFHVPFTRASNLKFNQPFEFELHYTSPTPYPDPFIGKYSVLNVPATTEYAKVKVRVDHHGLVDVRKVTAYELISKAEQERIEKEEKMDVDAPVENGGDTASQDKDEPMESAEEKKERRKYRLTDLPLVKAHFGMSDEQRLAALEAEGRMAANDKQEKDRVDAKNSLEEYVYDLRGKLQDESQLSRYVDPNDLSKLDQMLEEIVNWLYEEGEDCQRQVYSDKLEQLKKLGEPIKTRKIEADVRPTVIEDLARSIQQSHKILGQYRGHDEKYAHIPEEDMKKAENETLLVEKWLEEQRTILQRTQLHENPPVTVAEIRQHKQSFENIVAPIYNKPKPKVEPPPADAAATPQAGEQQQEQQNGEQPQSPKDAKMDVEG